MKDLAKLEQKLEVKFNDKDILKQSLVHRSYLNENPGFKLDHNERLEFLGDAVLELVVTDHLYKKYPNPEGELTNWRASLVNSRMLSKMAKDLGIEKYLFLSKGEAKDANSKARNFILADAFEAVIGAVYLDQGYEVAQKFILDNLMTELPYILTNELYLDPKSKFQELAQEKMKVTPTYKVIKETGPDHDKKFEVGVYIGKELIAKSIGSSKQEAQTLAAEAALKEKNW